MHSRWIWSAVAALLVTNSPAPTWAQQDEPREAVGEAAADTATKPGAEPADAPGSGDQDRPSPFEYESSEQISEDLSVSFPVDI